MELYPRRKTRTLHLGPVPIGGGAPVAIQSMNNTRTQDVPATLAQLEALADQYGCTVRLWGPTGAHDVYFVTVPKAVSMGVVRLSAVFQETHLFGWTSPNFVIFGAFDV